MLLVGNLWLYEIWSLNSRESEGFFNLQYSIRVQIKKIMIHLYIAGVDYYFVLSCFIEELKKKNSDSCDWLLTNYWKWYSEQGFFIINLYNLDSELLFCFLTTSQRGYYLCKYKPLYKTSIWIIHLILFTLLGTTFTLEGTTYKVVYVDPMW